MKVPFLYSHKTGVFLLFLFLCPIMSFSAEGLKGTLRGKVFDSETESPLIGVNVIVKGIEPLTGTTTDLNGEFSFESIPVGRRNIEFTSIGYEPYVATNIEISVKNHPYLNIKLTESVENLDEIIISAESEEDRQKPLNKMATVSSISVDIERTNRFAGSLGDPARMISSYAGVAQSGDQRNDIVVRGNSPLNVLWRLEGANIFNPNHFGAAGSTGGAVSILNNNLLSKSDFFTSAFVPEYANALSGVFDLTLREGNRERYAFLGQIGFNGVEFGAEGPISREKRSSFMAAYRHSFFEIFDAFGINFGVGANPAYKDLTFKVTFPSIKYGKLDLWGIAGTSNIRFNNIIQDIEQTGYNNDVAEDTNTKFGSTTAVVGLTHSYFFNNNHQLKTSLTYSYKASQTDVDSLFSREPLRTKKYYAETSEDFKFGLAIKYFGKVNAQTSFSFGTYADLIGIDYDERIARGVLTSDEHIVRRDSKESGLLFVQPFLQAKHKLSPQFTISGGVSASYFGYNNSFALEPRLGGEYNLSKKHSITFGYGLHSKLQPTYAYIVQTKNTDGTARLTNKDLGFSKSHHFVLGDKLRIGKNFALKLEGYYQHLFDLPVEESESAYSIVNDGVSFNLQTTDSLVNNGTGKNYGVEFTLEKYLSNNYYFLISGTVFNSKYTPSDNLERNTEFNSNYVLNVLGGIELPLFESKVSKGSLISDFKLTMSGGKRNPGTVDVEKSIATNDVIYVKGTEFEDLVADYSRLDFKIGFKHDFKKVTQIFELQLNNLTNKKNVFIREYDLQTQRWLETYQSNFLPIGVYRIQF